MTRHLILPEKVTLRVYVFLVCHKPFGKNWKNSKQSLIGKWNLDAQIPIKPHDLDALQELRFSMQQVIKYQNLDTKLCVNEL
jgi:hypothetical protein